MILSSDLKNFEKFEDPDIQAIFEAIRDRKIEVLQNYQKRGVDWYALPFDVIVLSNLYGDPCPHNIDPHENLFFAYLSEIGLEKKRKDLTDYLSQVDDSLFEACQEPGDFDFVKAYLNKGYDFHRYNSIFLDFAVSSKLLDIAEALWKDGSTPQKRPGIVMNALYSAESEFSFEYFGVGDRSFTFDLDRIRFLLERGAEVNHIVYKHVAYMGIKRREPETVLDIMKRYSPEGCELLRQYGAKTAAELIAENPALQLNPENIMD